jgi:hypothetical protein
VTVRHVLEPKNPSANESRHRLFAVRLSSEKALFQSFLIHGHKPLAIALSEFRQRPSRVSYWMFTQ